MCMSTATTPPRLDGEVYTGGGSGIYGALRGSTSESSANSTKVRLPEADPPLSSAIAATSPIVALPKIAATAVFSASNGATSAITNLKQQIQVIVRIRPIASTAARAATALPDGRTLRITPVPKGMKEQLDQGRLRESRKELEAAFDRVLGEGAEQEEIYNQIKTCVRLPFSGINACVFAYGQTGSGKTYTMVGDMSQEGTESTGLEPSLTSNDGPLSTKEKSTGNSGRYEVAEVSAQEGRSPVGSKEHEKLTRAGVGGRAGIVPRAVEDIFRLVKQGGVLEGKAETPLHPASPTCGFRDPLDTTPTAAPAADAAPSTRSGCLSASSSLSSSSDGSSSGQVPSAAHWPLAESTVYVPRAQIPKSAQVPSGATPAVPSRDPENSNVAKKGEVGGDEEKIKTLLEGSMVRGNTTCTCSVQCSYMQVYNGNVYDLLSPHASQQRPLPLLTSARLATTAAGSNVVGYERDVEMHATASREDSPPSCSQREGWGVSRVKGLSVHAVDSATQVMELLRQGGRNRRVRSTELNTHSSRSHTIVQFTITKTAASATATALNLSSAASVCGVGPASDGLDTSAQKNRREHPADGNYASRNDGDGGDGGIGGGKRCELASFRSTGNNGCDSGVVTTCAKLSLVDLAGSEKGRGWGGREAQKDGSPSQVGEGRAAQERERLQINASLSALSNCISCLGEAQRTHVPFRDNPLTRLLQESLLGGKTVVIATLRPSVDAQEESISTLNFAARCMRVVTRQRINEVVSETVLLERARREISALRRRLAQVETASTPSPPALRRPPPPLQTVEPPQALVAPAAPPLALAPERRNVMPASPEKRVRSSDGGSGNDGRLRRHGAWGEGFAGSGGGGRHQKYRALAAVPREAKPAERLPGKQLAVSGKGSFREPVGQVKPPKDNGGSAAEAGEPSTRENTATGPPPASVSEGETASENKRQPLVEGEHAVEENGIQEPPGPPIPPSSTTGAREARRERGVNGKTLLDARRGKDVVVRGRIATAVAAANAAAAAATAIVAAIGVAGGNRSQRMVASDKPAPAVPAIAAVGRKPRVAVRSAARKPQDGLTTTKADSKPVRPAPSSSPAGGPPAPMTRGARRSSAPAPAVASAARVAGRPRRTEESGLATAALIERFSTREDELLRELETWKARCKSFEEPKGTDGSSGSIGDAGCAGNRRRGDGIGESGLRAAPAAATPKIPLGPPPPASQQSRPQPPAGACPTEGIAPEAAPGVSEPVACARQFARGGLGAGSAVPGLTQDRELDSTGPRRRASVEKQSSDGWWRRRLPDVQREQRFAPQSQIALNKRAPPTGGAVSAQEGVGSIEDKRGGERVQEAAAVKVVSADKDSSSSGGGMGGVNPLGATVLENKPPPQTSRWGKIPRGERPLSISLDNEGNENYQGWESARTTSGGNPVLLQSRSTSSFSLKTQVEGVAVNPAQHLRRRTHGNAGSPQPQRRDFTKEPAPVKMSATIAARLDETELMTGKSSSRKLDEGHNTHEGTATIASPLKTIHSDTESFPAAASKLSPTLPPSPDRGRRAYLGSTAKLDDKGCDRHGLAPCTLCGEGAYGSQRSPGFFEGPGLPPPAAETALPGAKTMPAAGPCDRHLLVDCILCKMFVAAARNGGGGGGGGGGVSPALRVGPSPHQVGSLGRSLSLPGGGSGSLTDVPSLATRTAVAACAGDRLARCERHGLLGCFLCGFGAKAQAVPGRIEHRSSPQATSAASLRANERVSFSPTPSLVLPSPISDGVDVRTGGAAALGDGAAQPSRDSERGGLAFGSVATPETDPVVGGSEGASNRDRPEKEAPELFGHATRFMVATGEATAEAAGDSPLPAGIWGAPGVARVGLCSGDGFHPALSNNRGGRPAENPIGNASGHDVLAGGSAFRAVGGGRPSRHSAGEEGRGTPADDKPRRGHRRNSRGDTPRAGRGRASKPSKPSGHGRTDSGGGGGGGGSRRFSAGNVDLRDGKKSYGGGVRGREKHGGGDDLAARALTAALAVLR